MYGAGSVKWGRKFPKKSVDAKVYRAPPRQTLKPMAKSVTKKALTTSKSENEIEWAKGIRQRCTLNGNLSDSWPTAADFLKDPTTAAEKEVDIATCRIFVGAAYRRLPAATADANSVNESITVVLEQLGEHLTPVFGKGFPAVVQKKVQEIADLYLQQNKQELSTLQVDYEVEKLKIFHANHQPPHSVVAALLFAADARPNLRIPKFAETPQKRPSPPRSTWNDNELRRKPTVEHAWDCILESVTENPNGITACLDKFRPSAEIADLLLLPEESKAQGLTFAATFDLAISNVATELIKLSNVIQMKDNFVSIQRLQEKQKERALQAQQEEAALAAATARFKAGAQSLLPNEPQNPT